MTTSLSDLHLVVDGLQGLAARTAPESYDDTVVAIDREIRRLESVRLEVVAAAERDRIADRTGLADTSSWLAQRTRTGAVKAAADVRLATALAPSGGATVRPCAEALATGSLSPDHARVIVQATEQLPAHLSGEQVATVERDLVDRAATLSPDQLRRVARRALEVVEADQATVDRHEDSLLRTDEHAALARTRLTWHDNGDGTTSGHFTVPTLAASILIRNLQSMTSPRRAHLGASAAQAGEPESRRDWAHQSGLAFTELLEHLPTERLGSKVAATVVVNIDLPRLAAAVGAAGTDVGTTLSAGEVRRLACGAGILPAMFDGPGLPLDLGRTHRLFSENQKVAISTRHTTCAAEGCDRPVAWTELHHKEEWWRGGRTDLDNAVPVCGFHHRRLHDPMYHHVYGASGITFRQRS